MWPRRVCGRPWVEARHHVHGIAHGSTRKIWIVGEIHWHRRRIKIRRRRRWEIWWFWYEFRALSSPFNTHVIYKIKLF
jgi:hypothetical protein